MQGLENLYESLIRNSTLSNADPSVKEEPYPTTRTLMNRRTFVSTLAAASALSATSNSLLGANPPKIPRVGLIGCGWFGGENITALHRYADIEIVSLCDVNQKALEATFKKVKSLQNSEPKTYSDYRKMLADAHHDIVVIGTPDHWHALPAIAAMQAGADVFLEKPISVDVIEGEALVAAARKYDRVVQVNLQRRSEPLYQEAKEAYINSGKLGKIGLVECHLYGGGNNKKAQAVSPPAHLDFDMWTGPAPIREFVPQMESKGWRAFMEYGNGYTGDMGVHVFDGVRMLLGLGWPESISSSGGIFMRKNATGNRSDTQISTFQYPELVVSWEHRNWGTSPIAKRHWTDQWGARIIGEKGTLYITMLEYRFEPKNGGAIEGRHLCSQTNDLENVDLSEWYKMYDGADKIHVDSFMEARKNRSLPNCDVEEAHISSACCILANVALDLGRPLAYDPKSQSIPNDPEATARLARSYRSPWVHPTPDNV